MTPHKPRRFSAEGDFVERLEGPERQRLIPKTEVVSRMELSPRDTVLDLGAGIGYFALEMARRGAHVVAVDIERKMSEVLADRIRSKAGSDVSLVLGDISVLPFANSTMDHVFAGFVYHEVSDSRRPLMECARVLRKRGALTIVDFQKRETSIGPPVSERITPEEVASAARDRFDVDSRFESEVFYQLRFRKR